MNVYLNTDRQILREFMEDDLALLIALNGDPKVMKHLTGGKPLSPEHIRSEVLPCFRRFHAETPDFGYWAAVTKDRHDFIGWFQFRPRDSHGGGIELGFRLKPAAWGNGYATEGSRALVNKGFLQLGVRRLFARTMASNYASIRVLEKAGLTYQYRYSEQEFPVGNQHAVLYVLDNPSPGATASASNNSQVAEHRQQRSNR